MELRRERFLAFKLEVTAPWGWVGLEDPVLANKKNAPNNQILYVNDGSLAHSCPPLRVHAIKAHRERNAGLHVFVAGN